MAKFELEEYNRNISKEEFIADLKRVALKLKKNAITHEDYNKHGKFHSSTLQRKFGSWFVALKASGLEKTRNLNLNNEEMVADLVRVSTLLKKTKLSQAEYKKHGEFGITTFLRKFGSWFKALEKAGLQKTRNYGIAEEEYFKNLEEVWVRLGRQPHYNDIEKPLSKYSAGAYERRFGTWRKALEKFVKYVNNGAAAKESSRVKESPAYDFINSPNTIRHKTKRDIPWRLRFIIMKRDNFKCKNCGRSPATDSKIILHVDHIISYSKGGETVSDNLQTLCSVCNIGKGDID